MWVAKPQSRIVKLMVLGAMKGIHGRIKPFIRDERTIQDPRIKAAYEIANKLIDQEQHQKTKEILIMCRDFGVLLFDDDLGWKLKFLMAIAEAIKRQKEFAMTGKEIKLYKERAVLK